MVSMKDSLKKNGFTAYAVECEGAPVEFRGRDDYHKMLLISGIGEIQFNDAIYPISGPALLFSQPAMRCRWSLSKPCQPIYVCAFDNNILNWECVKWSERCETYFSSAPLFHLNGEQANFITAIFCRMVEEQKSSYVFKHNLIQNQLCVLKHMALRMTTAARESFSPAPVAIASRVVLLELVELGFPRPAQALHLN